MGQSTYYKPNRDICGALRTYEVRRKVNIAVVELFAGLRTTHVAATYVKNLNIVLSHAAEKCPFANKLAKKNRVKEKLFLDVSKMSQEWAIEFTKEAIQEGAEAILLIAGFPCKGLSRQNGQQRPNLAHKESALYTHIPRIDELLNQAIQKVAPGQLRVYKIVENVVMQKQPQQHLTDILGGIPTLIDAKQTCPASRPRLFWTDFEITQLPAEILTKKPLQNELKMDWTMHRQYFFDDGWSGHESFNGNYHCIVGWEQKSERPRDPRGIETASPEAISRWTADKWATGVRFYEDEALAWKDGGSKSRVISPTECERCLGFPVHHTDPEDDDEDKDTPYKRRNALGNAFAVPVISRLLYALTLSLTVTTSAAFPLWGDRTLPAPYRHDCLDDLLAPIGQISSKYTDLACEFDKYIPSEWTSKLVGPDPGAGGRKNRSQRQAATGMQAGTHMSKNGLQSPDPRRPAIPRGACRTCFGTGAPFQHIARNPVRPQIRGSGIFGKLQSHRI